MNLVELLGCSLDALKERIPGLIVDDEDDLQEGDTRIDASDPSGVLEFVLGDGLRVDTVFLHKDSSAIDVPGARLGATRAEVMAAHGMPESSGPECMDTILGEIGAWDRFFCTDYFVHYQYTFGADSVRQITIMAPAVAPR